MKFNKFKKFTETYGEEFGRDVPRASTEVEVFTAV